MVDDEGKKKTYYITMIAKDGKTKTTFVVVNKYEVQTKTNYNQNSIVIAGQTLYTGTDIETINYDLIQNITINQKTGKVTFGKERTSTVRSNNVITRTIEDNLEEFYALISTFDDKLNGGGGIVFTSETGQGQETRKGFNADAQSENIDLLMRVVGAANSAASNAQAKSFAKIFKQAVDAIAISKDFYDVGKDALNQGTKSTAVDSCTACGMKGPKGTINHGFRVVPVKMESNKK
jgi:hypothetical protein